MLCEACEQLGWKHPTKIQVEAIPVALEGELDGGCGVWGLEVGGVVNILGTYYIYILSLGDSEEHSTAQCMILYVTNL